MNSIPYSNRELDAKFQEMKNDREEKHADVMLALQRIEIQTQKTNGRVSKLEMWRGLLTGGIIVISVVVVPLVVYAFKLATKK